MFIGCFYIVSHIRSLNPAAAAAANHPVHPVTVLVCSPVSAIFTFLLGEFATGLGLLSIDNSSFLPQLFVNASERTEELGLALKRSGLRIAADPDGSRIAGGEAVGQDSHLSRFESRLSPLRSPILYSD